MTTIDTLTAPVVYTRAAWNDAWTAAPFLLPQDTTLGVAPTVDSSTFLWTYGRICRPGAAVFAAVSPASDLLGHYVKIEMPSTPDPIVLWVGRIAAIEDIPGANDAAATGTGQQILTAFGLERMLQQAAVVGSFAYIDSTVQQIDTSLTFNLRSRTGPTSLGNRSTSKHGASYVFSTDGAIWTGRDVVEYLLARYAPADATLPAFTLLTGDETDNLDNFTGPWNPPANVAAGLSMIIDRRRGHAWRLTWAATTQSPVVNVKSVFESDFTAGGATIHGAGVKIEFTPDTAGQLLGDVRIRQSLDHEYDEIVAVGEPLWICGTAPLAKAWHAAEEAAYLAATDDERALDVHHATFAAYRLTVTASKPFKNGGTAIGSPTVAELDGTLDTTATAPLFTLGHALTRQTPLRLGYDYTGGSEALITAGATPPPEFLPPILYGQAAVPDIGTVYGSLTGPTRSFAKLGAPRLGLRVADGELGLRIDASPAHIVALNHWTGATSAVAPVFDWEGFYITAAFRADVRLKVSHRPKVSPGGPAPRQLVIDVPGAEAWAIAPGTIIGVDSSGYVKTAAWIETRNDRLRLDAVVKIAAAWYGRTRSAITTAWRDIVYGFTPGTMVDTITVRGVAIDVGAIISRVSWNWQDQTTSLETDFGELDFAGFFGPSFAGNHGLQTFGDLSGTPYEAGLPSRQPPPSAPPALTATEGSVRQLNGTGDNVAEVYDLVRATG